MAGFEDGQTDVKAVLSLTNNNKKYIVTNKPSIFVQKNNLVQKSWFTTVSYYSKKSFSAIKNASIFDLMH